ncbi:MAG: hypothetical protein QOJ65_31, partial [Fimbriimonadaceae bacterium]|nr:hypothetical protein [Fimbriimonadaceae bacterium]
MHISRRTFLVGAAATPFSAWLSKFGSRRPAQFVRYNIMSTEGQKMCGIYKRAVDKMMTSPENSPLSWVFQWYTHAVRSDRSKSDELDRIFASGGNRDLADAMWSTCQSHRGGQDQRLFLPWHRMYVMYFEDLVREVSGNADFALPYWHYSSVVLKSGPIIPEPFLDPGDATNALWRPDRNPGPNGGKPIDENDPDALNMDVLKQLFYERRAPVDGFCRNLDFNLHGNVHTLTGNSKGMGQVPWAANDPIFWMHHCNIDRLWASWNAAGRTNPTEQAFLDTEFTFADKNGKELKAAVKDVLDMSTLNYTYDNLESVPAPPKPPKRADVILPTQTRVASEAGIVLGKDPVRVTLK